ncbi:MAG: AAA family ATPase [Gammaproteobacteria bacterium]|nr:AAA family ATPase [Gammaproteobacteria bacterium]
MTDSPPYIEGLVHAGKSTLIKALAKKDNGMVCVGEYVEFTTSKFPEQPRNLKDASEAREYFMSLEKKRRSCISNDAPVVILDRSVLSILAYHFAIEEVTKGEVPCFSESVKSLPTGCWIFPELCIYLDVNDSEISRRHERESGSYSPILLNPEFNAQLRRFYEKALVTVLPSLEIVRIDSSGSPEEVLHEANLLLDK